MILVVAWNSRRTLAVRCHGRECWEELARLQAALRHPPGDPRWQILSTPITYLPPIVKPKLRKGNTQP